jgi:hypothetical protein
MLKQFTRFITLDKIIKSTTIINGFSYETCKLGDDCINMMHKQPKHNEHSECEWYESYAGGSQSCVTKYSTQLEIEGLDNKGVEDFIRTYKKSLDDGNHLIRNHEIFENGNNNKILKLEHEVYKHARYD